MKIAIVPKRIFDSKLTELGITDDTVDKYVSHAFISINDSIGTAEMPHFKRDHMNVLNLFFDDVEEDVNTFLFINGTKTSVTVKAFDEDMAELLLLFIRNNETVKSFTVHCTAGVSRSGAVGTFLNDYFKGDYEEFKRANPHIHPNPTVMRLMNQKVRESI